jgi:predicted RNase H-like nuclease
LDAAAAAHTGYRTFLGKAERLPQQTAIDERGLRMEILY